VTHGDSGAALCHKAGADATGRMAAPELPRAGTRELGPRDMWLPRAALSQEARAGATGSVVAPELPVSGGITQCHGHVGACERTSCPSS
jgi:malate synthase